MDELSPYLLLSPKQKVKQWLRSLRCKFSQATTPDFLIVGAQKAGTSSLHQILKQHPDLLSSRFKELHYFSNDSWYAPGTLHQYHSFFPDRVREQTKYFEATPVYLYHPKVAARLHSYNPQLKLIVVLRDPTLRAFSAWKMHHLQFQESQLSAWTDSRTFAQAIEQELASDLDDFSIKADPFAYVKRGLYKVQLERYFEHFPREQILVLNSNELRHAPETTINQTLEFLGVSQQMLDTKVSNVGTQINEDFEPVFDRLNEFYKPHNQQLFELLGQTFDW